MENSFGSIIESANSILVLLPTKPYLDQVAAGLSLFFSLKSKKETIISCPSEMVVEFNRLVGVDKITSGLGNKNLTIRFTEYDASHIERVGYDIENGQFKLSVIPKTGFSSPKKEQLDIFYSGLSTDVVILIGGGNISHFPIVNSKEFTTSKILHIGTKDLGYSGLISFVRPASSVSELIADLIEQENYFLDADIATNLIAGIEDQTQHFSSSSVTADTFQKVANLMKSGGIRTLNSEKLSKEDFPQGSIPSKPYGKDLVVDGRSKSNKGTPQDWLEPKIYKGNTLS